MVFHDTMTLATVKHTWQKNIRLAEGDYRIQSDRKKTADRRMPFVVAFWVVNRSEDELKSLPSCWKMCCNCPGCRARLCSPFSTPTVRCVSSFLSPTLFTG